MKLAVGYGPWKTLACSLCYEGTRSNEQVAENEEGVQRGPPPPPWFLLLMDIYVSTQNSHSFVRYKARYQNSTCVGLEVLGLNCLWALLLSLNPTSLRVSAEVSRMYYRPGDGAQTRSKHYIWRQEFQRCSRAWVQALLVQADCPVPTCAERDQLMQEKRPVRQMCNFKWRISDTFLYMLWMSWVSSLKFITHANQHILFRKHTRGFQTDRTNESHVFWSTAAPK